MKSASTFSTTPSIRIAMTVMTVMAILSHGANAFIAATGSIILSGRPDINQRSSVCLIRAVLSASELSSLSRQEQFEILGVNEEELALGIEPDEVLQFIGTKKDLLAKFQSDLPQLQSTPGQLEAEVSQFLLDGEMLNVYLQYSQRKAQDPQWEPPMSASQEEDDSPMAVFFRIVSQYALWIGGGILLKDIVTSYMNGSNH